MEGISRLYNFEFFSDSLHAWRAYNIVRGKEWPWTEVNPNGVVNAGKFLCSKSTLLENHRLPWTHFVTKPAQEPEPMEVCRPSFAKEHIVNKL